MMNPPRSVEEERPLQCEEEPAASENQAIGEQRDDKTVKDDAVENKLEGATGSTDDSAKTEDLLDILARHLKARFRINDEGAEIPEPVIDEFSISGIAKYIKSDKCKNIIVLTGAGVSTSAGIPDFRSPGSGLYDNLSKYDLPTPGSIFDIHYFMENPKPFFMLAKELYPGSYQPTPAHYFIKLLEDKGLLLRNFTQNIDGLELLAGLSPDSVVAAHGTFYTSHCLKCGVEYPEQWVKERIFKDEVPKCSECNGIVKPDIVFFGEALPSRFFQLLQVDFTKCDLLIVMGTSLVVQPFASLIDRVHSSTPRLLINKEKCGEDGLFGGFDFSSERKYRDVAHLTTCDEGCFELAELLGWKEELKKLIEQGAFNENSKI